MMMVLGLYVFMLRTVPYQELQYQRSWRHAANSRVNRRPSTQFLGPDNDMLTLSGVLMPEITGGRLSLLALEQMAEQGKAWPLIEGSGTIYGMYVIEGLNQTKTEFFRDGMPRRIEFTLSLKRVDESLSDMFGESSGCMTIFSPSGMAIHKKWRQTYFSTPSSLTHSAYPFWSGALFNRGRNKADKVDIDLSHSNLAPGLLCADGQYRQIVTVEDAVRGGCNLFDLDQLRMEYSPDEYQNLLMCEFVDDLASVFPLSELQACMVDSWEVWTDFHALALRPFGWREVWIGYDPAKGTQNGDSAGCVVVAPPAVPGGKFRILERHQWRGMDFRAQADAIKKLTEQYNVTYIGIDSTGVGHGVYENVKAFFPAVREFVYNPNVKNALVLKAYDIISHRRLEFDAGHTDIAQSFMAIRRATTASGNRPTYEASRSEEASHADLAWATMHALFNEPLQGESANTSNILEIF
ncbi:hypothetical protein DTI25_23910 [Escherichia coli]|nr:hypothetical protein [Escherichia coli]